MFPTNTTLAMHFDRMLFLMLHFACVYINMTADTNYSSTPNIRIAHLITSLGILSIIFGYLKKMCFLYIYINDSVLVMQIGYLQH